MRTRIYILAICLVLPLVSLGQSDFIVTNAKDLKCEYTPVPKAFKTKKLSWGDLECVKEEVKYGAWFKIYPSFSQLRITVSTGYNWGTLGDPIIYVAHVDTVNGEEVLITKCCQSFSGAEGDFVAEAYGLIPSQKHYLLIGGDGAKHRFALHLTQRFDPPKKEETKTPPTDEVFNDLDDEVVPPEEGFELKNDTTEDYSMIIGRIRKAGEGPVTNLPIALLNDDLEIVKQFTTDENGFFRFEKVDHKVINLIKLLGDDDEIVLDMFMYNQNGRIIGKPISLGHRLHSFQARTEYFDQLNILTEKDVFVEVTRGNSSMTGKVVDRKTYLIGIKDVRVGLYDARKNLLMSTVSDENGRFSFNNLEDREYIVKVDHDPRRDYVEIVLTDEYNVPYAVSNSDDMDVDGYFRFRKLPEQTVQLRRMEMQDKSKLDEDRYALISETNRGSNIELTSIEFETGSSTLPTLKNDELDQLARELITHPGERVRIEGHTDNVGSESENLRLSKERAEAVKAYLVKQGVGATRIDCEGFGPLKPIASNKTEEGRRVNRRVEFILLNP